MITDRKYALHILEEAYVLDCKLADPWLIETSVKLSQFNSSIRINVYLLGYDHNANFMCQMMPENWAAISSIE